MKRYIGPIAIAALGASMFIIGATQAAPAPEEEPVVPVVPVEPVPADQEWTGVDGGVLVGEGNGFRVYDSPTLTPEHDQCWSDADVNVLLESGQFVVYGSDDPRSWGTHSIGGMRCGPADLPFPEAPAPAPAVQEPVVPSATECN